MPRGIAFGVSPRPGVTVTAREQAFKDAVANAGTYTPCGDSNSANRALLDSLGFQDLPNHYVTPPGGTYRRETPNEMMYAIGMCTKATGDADSPPSTYPTNYNRTEPAS